MASWTSDDVPSSGSATGLVADAINDGTTTVAPSQNAVHDALALKVPTSRTVAGLDLSADRTSAALLAALSGQAGADFAWNARKLTGVADPTADQDAATRKWVFSIRKGRYVDSEHYSLGDRCGNITNSPSIAPGANVIAWRPARADEVLGIDGLWFYCQTAVASAKGRVGLWLPSATTGLPTGNPVLTAAETDMSTTGYKAQTFTLVPSFLGQLWVGYASSSTAGYRADDAPVIDMGAESGANSVTWGWTSPWTYSSTALPDVSAHTFTRATNSPSTPPASAPPCVHFRIRRP